MKGATFQLAPLNPLNPHWASSAVANASLAATQAWRVPVGWTRNYYVEIDPLDEGYALPAGIDFIPTIYGDTGTAFGSGCTQANINIAIQTSTTGELITFTEPNQSDQANMTPARCAELWSLIRGSGLRITSPVVALTSSSVPFGTANDWISQFVTALGSADWDITAVDMYADITGFSVTSNAAALIAQLDAIRAAFPTKPVWLNETGMISFSSLPSNPTNDQVLAWMQRVAAICKARPWVERYCWYRVGPGDATDNGFNNITLYTENGVQTTIGKYYADIW